MRGKWDLVRIWVLYCLLLCGFFQGCFSAFNLPRPPWKKQSNFGSSVVYPLVGNVYPKGYFLFPMIFLCSIYSLWVTAPCYYCYGSLHIYDPHYFVISCHVCLSRGLLETKCLYRRDKIVVRSANTLRSLDPTLWNFTGFVVVVVSM